MRKIIVHCSLARSLSFVHTTQVHVSMEKLNNNKIVDMDVDEGDSEEGLEQDFSLDDLNPQNLPIDFEDDDDEEDDEENQFTMGSSSYVMQNKRQNF